MTDAERKAREVKKQSRPLVLAVKRAVMARMLRWRSRAQLSAVSAWQKIANCLNNQIFLAECYGLGGFEGAGTRTEELVQEYLLSWGS
jgi:hypothetical protein